MKKYKFLFSFIFIFLVGLNLISPIDVFAEANVGALSCQYDNVAGLSTSGNSSVSFSINVNSRDVPTISNCVVTNSDGSTSSCRYSNVGLGASIQKNSSDEYSCPQNIYVCSNCSNNIYFAAPTAAGRQYSSFSISNYSYQPYEDIVSTCSDYALANLLYIVQRIMTLVQIIAPILAIVALSITAGKMMMHPDDKKSFSGFKNTIIALLIVFLLPFIINFSMKLAGNNFDFTTCWNNANTIHEQINSTN